MDNSEESISYFKIQDWIMLIKLFLININRLFNNLKNKTYNSKTSLLIIKNKMKWRKIGLKENSKKCFDPRKLSCKT